MLETDSPSLTFEWLVHVELHQPTLHTLVMKTVYEYLLAIQDARKVDWEKLLQILTKSGIKPGTTSRILSPQSQYDPKTLIDVLDAEAFTRWLERFPPPVNVVDRVSAAQAGDSHTRSVTGSLLNVFRLDWAEPRTAVSWDGKDWSQRPDPGTHLLLVENLENFLRPKETLNLVIKQCGMVDSPDKVTLAFGSGNAASKACHLFYYQHFASVNCLFDLDVGGIQIYENIKALLAPLMMKPRFLIPDNVESRLQSSQWPLSAEDRTKIFNAQVTSPELAPLLKLMHEKRKKLEQETYLDW